MNQQNKHTRRWLVLGALLFLLAFQHNPGAQAIDAPGDATPENQPPRPLYEGLEELPFLDTGPLEPASQGGVLATALVDWSKIVFQSFRDLNWEIYLANGDGSNQIRLTIHEASDIHPRLNRGSTRIAFTSYRTGNYEIFAMNPDGSGLTRLTFNDTDDVFPFWSPDGTRIVFEAYRDGQPEIYVMNADGSGQTRLTWDGEYDGQPAWSPDGTRIAFVSRRTGGYRVWVMNADGSGQTQLSNQSFSGSPVWSPDGGQIAYDTDNDGDVTQELWLMNADGSVQREVYEPGGSDTDAWARSWSPDGRYVAFTRISWIFFEGSWYWTEAYLDAWDSVNTWSTIRLSSQGMDWRPDWQTTDTRAPTSAVNPLPAYFRGDPTVSWGGSDSGGSGIKTYDVHYRDAATGSWTDWQTGTTATSAPFSGTAGHTYDFRSRATDNALNVESWPAGDGDTYTTLYTWAVTGTVRDNREMPLAGAVITTTPGAFEVRPSDSDGLYAAYVANSASTYTVAWGKSGYDKLPSTSLSGSQDARFDVILSPGDNVVRNGGIESGSLGPRDWLVGGEPAPVVAADVTHTGDFAVLVGRKPVSVVNVSDNDGTSSSAQLAVDESGAVHVVWSDGTPGNHEIYYARRGSDDTWSSPRNISNNSSGSYSPQLATDGGGAVHVVWRDGMPGGYDDIYYSRRDSDGTWSSPQNLSNNAGSSFDPQLVADGNGTAHVVWYDSTPGNYDIYYARRGSDGDWSSPQNISNNAGDSSFPQMAADGGGAVHVVWRDRTPGNIEIYYARRGSDGAWSSPLNISNSSVDSYSPQLAVDGGGAVHVVWRENTPGNSDLYYARRGSDGTWSSLQNITNNFGLPAFSRLAIDGSGNVHVVWGDDQEDGTSGDISYARRGTDGTWSSPQNISNTYDWSDSQQLAVDGSGTVHVVWTDYTPGNPDIYYLWRGSDGFWSDLQSISDNTGSSFAPQLASDANETVHVVWTDDTLGDNDIYYIAPLAAGQIGDSTIAQAVTLPITMTHPTLSFFYQLSSTSPTSGTWFNVEVDDGITATTIFSTTASTTDWTHHWSDLTPWAGETITLTFNVHQTADQPATWAYLDEVSLGSAYPDLWVSKASLTPAALPSEQVSFTITYGNRGGVAASGVRITDTLPAELSFVDASPPPSATTPSIVWDVGDVPAGSGPFTIVVTATVLSDAPLLSDVINTATIGATTPELETANNVAQAPVFVGRHLYLPLVTREFAGP